MAKMGTDEALAFATDRDRDLPTSVINWLLRTGFILPAGLQRGDEEKGKNQT
ncbi:hypothetical protein Turpa_4120 [Turneriella parva DSM 21527]|uniref:Uncharacterized protein n=1 Tax=Turneriella parva (strain ATCC BAA-1111 / DSM 21527 / NCTC 11395 / H) TaxID=869212 RepID=I4BBU6_TURPD|nr:hypothetical protein Turpa_4120 [Turneriella parva DSM 21527]